MPNKPTIKIKAVDVPIGFNIKHNWIGRYLAKHFNLIESDQPDFLICSCFGSEHIKYTDCVKIFYTDENIIPNFNMYDYAQGFDYIDFGERYLRTTYEKPNSTIQDRTSITDDMFDRKFCNFIYSNATSGEGAVLRQEFCKKLMEYKHVDCPGKILNNMTAEDLSPRIGSWISSKLEFLKKYKFTIAFENSSSNGYTTEKLFQPFQAFSIPIYWGNTLVTRDFNPKAFINCNDYDNDFDAIINRIKEIDNNPDLYLAMLRESPMRDTFDFNQMEKMEKWLVNIVEKGNKPFNKNPHNFQLDSISPLVNQINVEKKAKEDALEKVNQLNNILNVISEIKPYKPLSKKKTGNFFLTKKEENGYRKTYICGIRISKQPVNLTKFIDERLLEMEKRITLNILKK